MGVHELHVDVALRDRLNEGALPVTRFEVREAISLPPLLHFHGNATQCPVRAIANHNLDPETRAYGDAC